MKPYHQTMLVTVKLVLIGSANVDDVVENMDYSFEHDAIVRSEIIGTEDI